MKVSFGMLDLSDLLLSRDPEVCIAAIQFINSKFLLNPAEIVLNFTYFLVVFQALLKDTSTIASRWVSRQEKELSKQKRQVMKGNTAGEQKRDIEKIRETIRQRV
jgi:hypothetical protein